MKITSFHAAAYTIGFEVEGREIAITVPFDRFRFEDIQMRVYEQHQVMLPFLTQAEWGEQLNHFVRDAIAAGQDIAPLSTVNRIVTGHEPIRKH